MSESDFSEFEKFTKNFQEMTKKLPEEFFKKFILKQALRAIVRIKDNTPVDTGALRAMWGLGSQNIVVRNNTSTGLVEVDPENTTVASVDLVGDNFEIVIWNGMEYASFIEFGTSERNWKWKDGRFMMTIAVNQIQQEMPRRFAIEFEEFLTKMGVG